MVVEHMWRLAAGLSYRAGETGVDDEVVAGEQAVNSVALYADDIGQGLLRVAGRRNHRGETLAEKLVVAAIRVRFIFLHFITTRFYCKSKAEPFQIDFIWDS